MSSILPTTDFHEYIKEALKKLDHDKFENSEHKRFIDGMRQAYEDMLSKLEAMSKENEFIASAMNQLA